MRSLVAHVRLPVARWTPTLPADGNSVAARGKACDASPLRPPALVARFAARGPAREAIGRPTDHIGRQADVNGL